MPLFDILYAEDVPHYGTVEIEADSPDEAVRIAATRDYDDVVAEPDWWNTACRRIVSIQDEAGGTVAEDIALDDCFLRYGGEDDRRRCDAAEAMLAELEAVIPVLEDRLPPPWEDDDADIAERLAAIRAVVARARGDAEGTS